LGTVPVQRTVLPTSFVGHANPAASKTLPTDLLLKSPATMTGSGLPSVSASTACA
jgi:hypothetical protein